MAQLIGILSACLVTSSVWATNAEDVEEILKRQRPPAGVLFETAETDEDFLQWAIPEIIKFSKKLKQRFPKIAIAVISHGNEMFALKNSEQKAFSQLHNSVKNWLAKEKIPLHVCGTYASWYQTTADQFPAYVDVVPAAPIQIRDYEDIGYQRIRIEIE